MKKKPKITIQELIDRDRPGVSSKQLEMAADFFFHAMSAKPKTIFVGSLSDAYDFASSGNGDVIYINSKATTMLNDAMSDVLEDRK